MGFSSQEGQVGFKTQAAAGTYSDPGAASPNEGVFMRTRSGGLSPNRELLIPDPEIGGGRDIPDAYLGAVSWSGEYEFYARTKAIATLFRAGLGDATSATTGVAPATFNTHTFTPGSGNLSDLSVEDNVGGNFETFRFTDAKVNTLHLEAEANGYLMGSVGLIAKLQTAGNTKTAVPAYDINPLFVGTNITLTYNGVQLPAKSFTFDFTNNMEDDDFRLGSFFLGDLTPKRREVTFSTTVRPNSSAQWRQAVYGTTAATQAGGLTTKQELVITCETYEVIGTSAEKHSISFTVPKAMFAPFSVEPSGDDVLEYDLEIRALRPDPTVPLMTAVVKNESATIA